MGSNMPADRAVIEGTPEASVTSVIDGKVDYSINGDILTVSKDAQGLEYRAG